MTAMNIFESVIALGPAPRISHNLTINKKDDNYAGFSPP